MKNEQELRKRFPCMASGDEWKKVEVEAALQGFQVHPCPCRTTNDKPYYGPHSEPSSVIIHDFIPCKNHLHFYLGANFKVTGEL